MDDTAEAVLRVVEEIVEVIALEQADEFFIGKQDVLTLRIVNQDGGWQVKTTSRSEKPICTRRAAVMPGA